MMPQADYVYVRDRLLRREEIALLDLCEEVLLRVRWIASFSRDLMLQPCGGAYQDNSCDDKGRANNETDLQLLV